MSWEFPKDHAWPPGWPKKMNQARNVTLHGSFDNGVLSVWCLDQYGEPSDSLEGQFIRVIAGTHDKKIRIRKPKDKIWAEGGLLLICEYQEGKYGSSVFVEVDHASVDGHHVVFDISVYGIDGGPTTVVGE